MPETESQGRIRTSTATVAVLPEAEDVDVEINESDLQIDVYRSSGPGGQSVNTTNSAVRIAPDRAASSSRCRTRSRSCRTATRRCACCARASTSVRSPSSRRSWPPTGSRRSARGERAEKIRTYNFPQGRVTDHRIKLTVHNLDAVLAGDVDEISAALQNDEKRRKLEAQAEA